MKRLLKTVGFAFAGALLGYIIGSLLDSNSVTWYIWFFVGVPCGWSFLGRYFGHLVSTHLPTTIFLLVIRVSLAGLLGWVLIPIEIIRSLVEFFSGIGE